MKVQTLVATMKQTDHTLLEKMNIQTDAIVGNQCDRNEFTEFTHNGRNVKWLSLNEKGVGLNRNNTLMRATEEIVLFADDDIVYCDGYEQVILDYYKTHPKADVVIFNMRVKRGGSEFETLVHKEKRVNKKSAAKYGTFCISARTEKLRFANIFFHLSFGGGTKYSCGEDTIFLQECLSKGLRVYTCKNLIGTVDHGESTWFKGFTDKYFFDKGVLFYKISPFWSKQIALYHCFKHRGMYKEYGWFNAYKQAIKGICSVR